MQFFSVSVYNSDNTCIIWAGKCQETGEKCVSSTGAGCRGGLYIYSVNRFTIILYIQYNFFSFFGGVCQKQHTYTPEKLKISLYPEKLYYYTSWCISVLFRY